MDVVWPYRISRTLGYLASNNKYLVDPRMIAAHHQGPVLFPEDYTSVWVADDEGIKLIKRLFNV